MLNDEIASCLARFFESGKGPTHDELDRLFRRAELDQYDPKPESDAPVGKMKRLRAVFGAAIEQQHKGGPILVKALVDQLRSYGCFREGSDTCPGGELVGQLRAAFRQVGYDLDPNGVLRPRLMENLDGVELTEALWGYVRRARTGADDAELVIGSAKNLEEATVRHVLTERAGGFSPRDHFPTALANAFIALGLEVSTAQLDRDPYKAMQQAIFLLASAVNRLRNEKGDGHGRPMPSTATALEGRLSAEGSALVAELLLTGMGRA